MSQRLTAAIEELRAEKARIQADVDELRRQVKSRETQLKQINKALSVLDVRPGAKSSKQKPAANRQDVVQAITNILTANGPLKDTELKRLVSDKITASGKSRMGLALRFKEALNDGRFARGNDGLVVDKAEPAST